MNDNQTVPGEGPAPEAKARSGVSLTYLTKAVLSAAFISESLSTWKKRHLSNLQVRDRKLWPMQRRARDFVTGWRKV